MHSIIRFINTDDFEEGEIRPVTANAFNSVDPKKWNKKVRRTDPKPNDFGIDKDRKVYMYYKINAVSPLEWVKLTTIEKLDEQGNILFDKNAS